jgi:hypothetical protein
MSDGDRLQLFEMPLHQYVGVEVADPLLKRGRALEVREQQGDVAYGETFGRANDLGAEMTSALRSNFDTSSQPDPTA